MAALQPTLTGLWEDLIEDQVDKDAGDGDVHPDGPGPAGDFFVGFPLLFDRAPKGDEDHRDDDGGEDCVCEEDGEVDRAEPLRLEEARGFGVIMIVQLRNEEEC